MPLHSILQCSARFSKLMLSTDKLPQSTLSYHILKSLGCITYTPLEQSELIIAAYVHRQQQYSPFIIHTDIIPIILMFYHHTEIHLPPPLTEKQFHTKYTIDQQDTTNPSPNPVWIHSGQACSITNQFEKNPTNIHENDTNNHNHYALYMMKCSDKWSIAQHQKIIYILQQCRGCEYIVNLKDWCMTKARTYQIVERGNISLGKDLFDIILKYDKVDRSKAVPLCSNSTEILNNNSSKSTKQRESICSFNKENSDTFTEFSAIQIIRNIAKGLRYLHSLQFVHGNITPDNLRYYDKDIKIDNFKSVGDCCNDDGVILNVPYKCNVLYAAPEVIELSKKQRNKTSDIDLIDFAEDIWLQIKETAEEGYNMKADIWSLGVIMYTMLCGYPPFIGNDEMFIRNYKIEDKYKILDRIKYELGSNQGLRFHEGTNWDYISSDAKDLLRKLLVIDKRDRLDAEEILKHSWMKQTNFRNSWIDGGFGKEYKNTLKYWQELRSTYRFKLSVL